MILLGWKFPNFTHLKFMREIISIFLTLAILAVSCTNHQGNSAKKPISDSINSAVDKHTLSNADSIELNHLYLDISVDLTNKQIVGSATWSVVNKNKLKELKLDTYDLTIDSVSVNGKNVSFRLDSDVKYLGKALHIPITEDASLVKISYKTGKNAHALQWLDPAQTHDKKHQFLFTQSESIYARSWIPCADGPGIRFTYDARVQVPKGLLALMSAENPQQINDSSIYHFRMTNKIPAYLMALAVGDIVFRKIDNRTGVYAEPGMIDKASWELKDIGNMVYAAEKLYGPYRWGRYDVIILPPGFPIGGMENPMLTFSTPTIIAGDRSLVSLIAHELAHSWSGNLVTNATWNDFWLNEGFTNYFERRITEEMLGKDYADMLWELGYQILVDNVKELGATSKYTWLKESLNGRDPDDGFSDIPYEKGSLFLKLIENSAGRPKFDSFLNKYFNEHAFKTITTEQFLTYLDSNLIKNDTALRRKLTINDWVYGPGIPANCPRTNPTRFKAVEDAMKTFPASKETTKNWSTHEWLYYLHFLADNPTLDQMQKIDALYNFTNTGNSEIADVWFIMAVKTNYSKAFPAMDNFLSSVGRRKFLEPLYKEMMKTPKRNEMAKEIYKKYRPNYHPLAQESLDKIVGFKSN